ncbi:MAG TPA: sulfatase-like hydrolase/transferase [Gemmataceae bacterium]|nr:sulfatase-like hydrolase/transferase [Gemmataceae bacterium]
MKRAACWSLILPVLVLLTNPARPAPAQESRPRRPNILFLLADDQRPDTIAALGNPRIRTPNLDALARQGAAFTRAVSPNPICTPSRVEILTGCSGYRNGVLYFGDKIKSGQPLWPRTLREAGYHTWYVGKGDPAAQPSRLGYEESQGLFAGGGQRWEKERKDFNDHKITGYYGYVFRTDDGRLRPEKGVGLTPNISAAFADAAIGFLRRKPSKPFFLHVNFTAPHDPLLMPPGYRDKYDPNKMQLPPNFLPEHPFDHGNLKGRDEQLLPWPRTPKDVRAELAVYYAVISHLDEQIGRILAVLKETGQAENTLVIFSSDHGLALGSHGLRGKQNMYEHTVGVPLLLRGPGIPAGKRFATQCYLRDLFPTVCDLARIAIPEAVEGKSLAQVLAGKTTTLYPHVFGHFRDVQRMVRTEQWKLIFYPKINKYQLFDLSRDPHELRSLADDPRQAKVLADLRRKLTEGPWR